MFSIWQTKIIKTGCFIGAIIRCDWQENWADSNLMMLSAVFASLPFIGFCQASVKLKKEAYFCTTNNVTLLLRCSRNNLIYRLSVPPDTCTKQTGGINAGITSELWQKLGKCKRKANVKALISITANPAWAGFGKVCIHSSHEYRALHSPSLGFLLPSTRYMKGSIIWGFLLKSTLTPKLMNHR